MAARAPQKRSPWIKLLTVLLAAVAAWLGKGAVQNKQSSSSPRNSGQAQVEPKSGGTTNAKPDMQALLAAAQGQRSGVWVEGQVGSETTWHFLAIDTSNPYNDTRPLASPNQPEVRRYRLCYWDGDPDYDWSNVVTVTFGG